MGKKKPIEIMQTNEEFLNVFSNLGENELTEEDVVTLEAFTCCMFRYTKLKKINKAQYAYFEGKCKPKASSKPLDSLKSVDQSLFPP